MTLSTQLKECPFCGGEAIVIQEDRIWIECADCPSKVVVGPFDTEAETIAAWGRRRPAIVAALGPTDAIKELANMLRSYTIEDGCAAFDHSPEEFGIWVMENHKTILAALELQERVKDVKRYDISIGGGCECCGDYIEHSEDKDGDWVKYEDLKGPTNAG